MRGVGGPLLCIADLLSDVGETKVGDQHQLPSSPSLVSNTTSSSSSSSATSITNSKDPLPPFYLSQLFEENYNQLKEALSENGHSWTAQTLKLCSALETAEKLIQSANSDVKSLSEKVGVLQNIVRRGDCAVKAAKLVTSSQISEK
ncbi:hypothetical protein IFM89_009827 [Coptis chinensis]|uniref:Uncharacterized protein n=1 Tax=Coptis chinensis TaxID=261450 RepID=A0A835HZB8_9MAGN|nr:hypothetical protein IFM89_009827 [Coptis chinensis]